MRGTMSAQFADRPFFETDHADPRTNGLDPRTGSLIEVIVTNGDDHLVFKCQIVFEHQTPRIMSCENHRHSDQDQDCVILECNVPSQQYAKDTVPRKELSNKFRRQTITLLNNINLVKHELMVDTREVVQNNSQHHWVVADLHERRLREIRSTSTLQQDQIATLEQEVYDRRGMKRRIQDLDVPVDAFELPVDAFELF